MSRRQPKLLPVLPGWRGEFGVDLSGYDLDGTHCDNCRSLVDEGDELRCTNSQFIAQAIPEQDKRAGSDVIPVKSGDPRDYCCNVWAMAEDLA